MLHSKRRQRGPLLLRLRIPRLLTSVIISSNHIRYFFDRSSPPGQFISKVLLALSRRGGPAPTKVLGRGRHTVSYK